MIQQVEHTATRFQTNEPFEMFYRQFPTKGYSCPQKNSKIMNNNILRSRFHLVVIRILTSILKNKFLIYLLLTLLPTVSISTILAQHQEKFLEDQNQHKALQFTNLHT